MAQSRLYNDLAYLWPLVSPPEEHAQEAGFWQEVLREKLGPGRHPILELGVGGGHLLSHLTDGFQAVAVDISEQMLALSRRLNPQVEHQLGDMRAVRLGRVFKAVLIQDAICYMLTEDDLRATFRTAQAHLAPGGVLLVAPDWLQETYPGKSTLRWKKRHDDIELDITEHLSEPGTHGSTIESTFVYVIKEQGTARVERDHHVTALFPRQTWLHLIAEAGFEVEEVSPPVCEGGYGGHLFVGVPSPSCSRSRGTG